MMGVLYTHKHPDHIGDQSMIKMLLDNQILASAETIKEIGGGTEIADGQVIDLLDGYPWTVIETPGHCPGMVSLVSEMGILSADNVTMVGTILVPSKDGSMTRYFDSLKRLKAFKPKLLFRVMAQFAPHQIGCLTELSIIENRGMRGFLKSDPRWHSQSDWNN